METEIRRKTNFIQLLIDKRVVSAEEGQKLSIKFKGDVPALLSHLIRNGLANKEELGKLWGDSIGVAYVNLKKTLFQSKVVQFLPKEAAMKHNVICIYEFGTAVTIASADPNNVVLMDNLSNLIGKQLSPVFSFPDEIRDAITIHYQSVQDIAKMTMDINAILPDADNTKVNLEVLKRLAGESAVVEYARSLLLLGLQLKASDIHIEPCEDFVRIRYRVDGMLQEKFQIDKSILDPLVARLKIVATADISEKRKPQDGRINLELEDRSIDFRFSCVPTIYGEKIVMRILGQLQRREVPSLGELNFSSTLLAKLHKTLSYPNGIFFVTGPTGSGKSTTLYAALKHLNKPDVNIMTIEDPVEYRLHGINQIQVNHTINLNFAMALRAFLRQDPDIILVGEIRDQETAKIASEAALTGHFVLATMHTNDSVQAITRLVEIGVEPHLVAPAMVGAMAQRLVRRICDKCREPYAATPEEMDKYFIHDGETPVQFYRGKGCETCGNSGYMGRIAVHEIFIMTDEVRELVARHAPIHEVQHAVKNGPYESLRYDCLKKVLRGLTTVKELERITVSES